MPQISDTAKKIIAVMAFDPRDGLSIGVIGAFVGRRDAVLVASLEELIAEGYVGWTDYHFITPEGLSSLKARVAHK